jgi:hypothetical protein
MDLYMEEMRQLKATNLIVRKKAANSWEDRDLAVESL